MARVWSGREPLLGERDQLAVDPRAEDVARLDMQVGRAPLHRRLDDLFHGRSPVSRWCRDQRPTATARDGAGKKPMRARTSRIVSPRDATRRGGPVAQDLVDQMRAGPAARARASGSAPASRSYCPPAPACSRGIPTRRRGNFPPPSPPSRAARSTCAGGRGCRSPACPGSFLVTRAGSVLAGRSFCQISSGVSRSPMVFPRLLDILAWPSSPMIRLASVSSGFGSGKPVVAGAELRVPPAGDLAGELEMLSLVLARPAPGPRGRAGCRPPSGSG